MVDDLDIRLLELIQLDGRMSVSDLSRKLALSRPSVTERLRRLQEQGTIRKFTAQLSPAAIGKGIEVMIQMGELSVESRKFEEMIMRDEDVIECHRITGPSSYIMKAAVSSMDSLRALVDRLLPYGRVNTSLILSSPVDNKPLAPLNAKPLPLLRQPEKS